ncbi:MAG: beta-ketoacyl-[acyl-carrier-protein] synthase family protein, partial [Bacteroidales bacterium]|nr:beta-ketoacyl-[acyl-carrier-protein] synthase family protein [Candidatus Colimorpha onthohippi]
MGQLWITGFGIVSAIGLGKDQTKESLLASKSGIGKVCYLNTEHTEFPIGEVKLTNEQMSEMLGIDSGTPVTRTFLIGTLALQEAIKHAHLNAAMIKKAALVSGTTVGGMDKSEKYY